MPRSDEITVVGIRWIALGKTELELSSGKKVQVTKVTTVGWNTKLGDGPIILIGEERYRNCVPKKDMTAWRKKDIQALAKKSA